MTRRDPALPRIAGLLVSVLLLAYPQAVRTRFGREMRQFIADARDERRVSGRGAGPIFWIKTFWGLLTSAVGARRDAAERADIRPGPPRTPRRRRGAAALAWLSAIPRSLRYGCRGLRHAPAFTLTTLLTLGLGVGAAGSACASPPG